LRSVPAELEAFLLPAQRSSSETLIKRSAPQADFCLLFKGDKVKMKRMDRPWQSRLLFLACLVFCGCTLKTIETIETGDKAAAECSVLIAAQKSRFKEKVVADIKSAIKKIRNNHVFYIKVVDLAGLAYESPDQYCAIVLINRCMAGQPDPRVEIFIDDIQDKHKLVVLTTGRLDSWKPASPEVDAITSASIMSEAGTVADTIAAKVMEIVLARINRN